jgi:hypothetical protein
LPNSPAGCGSLDVDVRAGVAAELIAHRISTRLESAGRLRAVWRLSGEDDGDEGSWSITCCGSWVADLDVLLMLCSGVEDVGLGFWAELFGGW